MKMSIPARPTNHVRFENGVLRFDILTNCLYGTDLKGFVGGKWASTHLETDTGAPARIRIDGDELVVEKLTKYGVDKDTGYLVGGEWETLLRFKIKHVE